MSYQSIYSDDSDNSSREPYRSPYLEQALKDPNQQQVVHRLSQLIETIPNALEKGSTHPYQSVFPEQSSPGSSFPTFPEQSSPSPSFSAPKTPTSYISADKYRQLKQQREDAAAREAVLQQQAALEQAARQHQTKLEEQAKQFLVQISHLDPLDGNRLWFEQFVETCERQGQSRLQAAIEFIQTMGN